MNSLTPKTILVTGATSGIGKCTTIELIKRGAQVAFCGKSPEKMEQLLTEISLLNPAPHFGKAFDVLSDSEISTFVSEAREKLGSVDVLINCAGLNSARGMVEDIDPLDLDYMMRVNTYAPLAFIQQVIKEMKQKNEGAIINVLSTVCLFSNEGIGAYTASKAAFDAMLKVLRKEVRKNNILVSSIYPGGVNTAFRANERPDYLSPEDIADTIVHILESKQTIAFDELVLRPFVETNFA